MKIAGVLLILASIVFGITMIVFCVKANYEYEREYSSLWTLADKSSTIEEKSKYINQFIEKLENSDLQGVNDALYFPTDNNKFDYNLMALKTLGERLEKIKEMDINSFEYQTAIQQITAQEQGEADAMLGVLSGCWWKINHYAFWNVWLGLLWIFMPIIGVIMGFALIDMDSY